MYEGRNAQLFHPTTAVITWMSNPAQPSFVWQIYHYDLEPMSSFFAVMQAGEMVHIQFNEANGELQVINNLPDACQGCGCACCGLQPGRHAGLRARDQGECRAGRGYESGRDRVSGDGLAGSLYQAGFAGRQRKAAVVKFLLAQPARASGRFQRSEQDGAGHARCEGRRARTRAASGR